MTGRFLEIHGAETFVSDIYIVSRMWNFGQFIDCCLGEGYSVWSPRNPMAKLICVYVRSQL